MMGTIKDQNPIIRKREDHIDLLRGLTILLMVFVHVGFGWEIDKWAHAFHMPLFFVLSGYFFKGVKRDKACFLDRIRRITRKTLIPYISFGFISYVLWLVFCYKESEMTVLKPLISLLWDNTKEMPISGSLWFLTAFFYGSLVFNVICFCFDSCLVILLLSFGISSMSIVLSTVGIVLPWSLNAGLLGVSFISVGYVFALLKKSNSIVSQVTEASIWRGGVCLVLFSVTTFLNVTVNMRSVTVGNVFLFWINSIGLVLALVIICKKIIQCHSFKSINWIINKVKTIGKDSVTYLCLNQLVILFFNTVLIRLIPMFLLKQIICFVLSIVLMFYLDMGIRATKLRFIVGE